MNSAKVAISFQLAALALCFYSQSWASVAIFITAAAIQALCLYLDSHKLKERASIDAKLSEMQAQVNTLQSQVSNIIVRVNQEFI